MITNNSNYTEDQIEKALDNTLLHDDPDDTLQSFQDNLPGTLVTKEDSEIIINNKE